MPDPDPAATAAMQALAVHRWKSMGVAWVECECGWVVHGEADPFPADEAFRRHLAEAVSAAAARYLRTDAYETGKQAGAAAERERCALLAERQRFLHFAGMIRNLGDENG